MVTFLSLFLWLMTGVHHVEVSPDPLVVSVEIVLDGRKVGIATAPAWSVPCDFGERPRPHELVAVAYDADGIETGRARQFVNLPRPGAEVEIVLEAASSDAPEQLRVITESSERLEPLAVFVNFDGRALLSSGDGRFPLPEHDRGQVHIISAEAHYPGGLTARSDVTFGGAYGSQVATELTAVPVISDRRDRLGGALSRSRRTCSSGGGGTTGRAGVPGARPWCMALHERNRIFCRPPFQSRP